MINVEPGQLSVCRVDVVVVRRESCHDLVILQELEEVEYGFDLPYLVHDVASQFRQAHDSLIYISIERLATSD